MSLMTRIEDVRTPRPSPDRPHDFERNTEGLHFLVCRCGKNEAHAIHHRPAWVRRNNAKVLG